MASFRRSLRLCFFWPLYFLQLVRTLIDRRDHLRLIAKRTFLFGKLDRTTIVQRLKVLAGKFREVHAVERRRARVDADGEALELRADADELCEACERRSRFDDDHDRLTVFRYFFGDLPFWKFINHTACLLDDTFTGLIEVLAELCIALNPSLNLGCACLLKFFFLLLIYVLVIRGGALDPMESARKTLDCYPAFTVLLPYCSK